MGLHESARAMLELMHAAGLGIEPGATPAQVREAMDRSVAAAAAAGRHPVHEVQDRMIATEVGALAVRVYRPSGDTGLPLLVWFHGGGWVIGGLESHDQLCRLVCDAARVVVMSVDYRLAPEAKFPAAVDDCVAAWAWAGAHARELGADPARIALGGDSAGGNLAAVTCVVARERGLPQPRLQLLVYPVTDHEFDSPSMRDNATGYFLEADHMRWFFSHYARDDADYADWRMSPLRAPDLSGLAPAVVVTAEFDPLRDQGEAYARRLAEAGTPTELVRMPGTFHGSFAMHELVEPAREPWEKSIAALRAAVGVG